MNEPRVVESVTNECQSLGRAHESSSARAEQLIACLEGEIAKRDARIVELEADLTGTQSRVLSLQNQWRKLDSELAAIKAQEPVAYIPVDRETGEEWHPVLKKGSGNICDYKPLYAAPVSEAKAQGVVMPERDAVIRKVVGMCNRIPGSTTWNAAEYAYDELAARLNATPAAPAADAGLVEALEMIINPIEAMRRELQGGEQLNGMVAMQLASDPEYLRGVAKAALAAHRATGVV